MAKSVAKNLYDNFERYFCAFLLVVMVLCLALQVFFRFALNAALTWSEELSRFAFIWLVYMGAMLGAKERIHIRVTAPQLLFPAAVRRFLSLLADLIWVIFNLFFAYQGIKQVQHLLVYSYTSPSLSWSMAYIYAVVPVGFILMSYRIVEGHWRDYRRGGLAGLGEDLHAAERQMPKAADE